MHIHLTLAAALTTTLSAAPGPITLNANDFGAHPDDGGVYHPDVSQRKGDDTLAFRKALATAKEKSAKGPVILIVPPGTYDFYPQDASRRIAYTSNCTEGNSSGEKVIAIDFTGINDLTISGKGATFMMRGKMTMLVAEQCKNLTIEGITFDFKRPTMSEITCLEKGDGFWIGQVHQDSDYKIENNRITWVGEGWTLHHNMTQHYDPTNQTTWRGGDPTGKATSIEDLGDRKLKFLVPDGSLKNAVKGRTYQMRNTTRDACAMWFNHCKTVSLRDVTVRFIHGFGILGQFSENFLLKNLTAAPDPKRGRTNVSAADIIHFSGCKGMIQIEDSTLTAAHDDALNIHGTHLKIVEMPAKNQARLRFGQPQSWGFQAYFPGDEIEFVDRETLLPHGKAKVTQVEMLKDPREQLVTFDSPIPQEVEKNDVIENVTWTPSVKLLNCRVAQIPTRGILLTTRRPILIEGNTFERTRMPAILCEDDANGWFESGPLHKLTIRNNTFDHSGTPAISMHPMNRKHAGPVHKNITIENNRFLMDRPHAIALKSCDNVKINKNTFSLQNPKEKTATQLVSQHDSTNVTIEGNQVKKSEGQ